MAIHWYPKHMNTARREIERALPKTDLVIEILDARLPRSSSNPLIEELRGERVTLVVLNKADLADPKVTKAWQREIEHRAATRAIPLVATDRAQVRSLPSKIRAMTPPPRPGRPVKVLIMGIPNVGKSTLLNTLKGRKVARVGDEPAVTKGQQIVELQAGLRIVDTPGLLWPRLDDDRRALRLAASGAIRDDQVDEPEVAAHTASYLAAEYSDRLRARYKLDGEFGDGYAVLDAIGRRRGCLVSGGTVDFTKAARVLLGDLRSGRLGRISLERPESVAPSG